MRFGSQTVGFVTITAGTRDRLGAAAPVRTTVNVTGCLMRPLSATELITNTDVATEAWRCTAPPVAAALAATATGELVFNGNTYLINGVQSFRGFNGIIDHVRVTCERQVG